MAEKKVLWLTGEKNPDNNQYEGALIDAEEVYDAVYIDSPGIRAWVKVSGNTEIQIPNPIKWEDEEYESLKDMDSYGMWNFLDSLVGQEGKEMSEEYTPSENYLVYDYYNNEFSNFADWFTIKCYDYVCSSNHKTIALDIDNGYGYNKEYELEITETYNLDYLRNNSTNFEYGGMGNHALLHKVIIDNDKDDNRILWHEWSQWQGSELDTGYLLTAKEVLEALSGLYNTDGEYWDIKPHPELEEIKEWLGVKNDEEENTENK